MPSNQPTPVPETDPKLIDLKLQAQQDIPNTKRLSVLLQLYHVTPSARPTSLREHFSRELEHDEQTYYRSLRVDSGWTSISTSWLHGLGLSAIVLVNTGKDSIQLGTNLKTPTQISDDIAPGEFFVLTCPSPVIVQHLIVKSSSNSRAEFYAIPN